MAHWAKAAIYALQQDLVPLKDALGKDDKDNKGD
jgi:hypothetical protein